MSAVADFRRLPKSPKFISFSFLFSVLFLVSLSHGSWARSVTRKVGSQVSEIRDETSDIVSDDDRVIIGIRKTEQISQDSSTIEDADTFKHIESGEERKKKTILSELPGRIEEIAAPIKRIKENEQGGQIDVAKTQTVKKVVQENANKHMINDGIRRFDAEIDTDDEEQIIKSEFIEKDKVIIKSPEHSESNILSQSKDQLDIPSVVLSNNAEKIEKARADTVMENESVLKNKTIKISESNDKIKSEIPEAVLLDKNAELKNPFAKKSAINGQINNDGKEDTEEERESIRRLRSGSSVQNTVVHHLKEQALMLQEQIRNTSFLQRLKEQTNVLPEMPIFTEQQLLQVLQMIVTVKKSSDLNETFSDFNINELNEVQQEILKCAEKLVVEKQRQSFMSNMYECVRGLSVLNCMRIFIYPILVEYIPESLSQSFPSLPIEINIADLIQGNRDKVKSARYNLPPTHVVITPEWKIYSILKDMLKNYPVDDKIITYVDAKNETLASLLSPSQLYILQMGENLLPESARQEYADQMFSCLRRFEYFSCVKYFAWPMIRQYVPILPEFPTYYWSPPTIAEYAEIIPYPASPLEIGQLPEIVDADGTRAKKPKPETIILRILQNTLREHPRLPPAQPSFIDYNTITINPPISQEQIASIRAAEQLLPISIRSEYISKTMSCMNKHDYLYCIKHSTWPTVRQFSSNLPRFPEFHNWIADYANKFPDKFSDVSGYIPAWFSFPSISGIFGHHSGSASDPTASGGSSQGNQSQSGSSPENTGSPGLIPAPPLGGSQSGGQFYPPYPFIPVFPVFPGSPGQMNQSQGDGSNPWIQWVNPPNGSSQGDPQDPQSSGSQISGSPGETDSEESPGPVNYPQLCTTTSLKSDENYGKALTSWEDEITNILTKARDSIENVSDTPTTFEKDKIPLFLTLRQLNILYLSENVLSKDKMLRENITMKSLECLQEKNSFAYCMKSFIFPALKELVSNFPEVPALEMSRAAARADDVSIIHDSSEIQSVENSNIDAGKTKKIDNIDPVISVTGTRFVPLLTEHPESLIYNILRSIRLSDPKLSDTLEEKFFRNPVFVKILTERQEKILTTAEQLIPESERKNLVNKTIECARENVFLTCSRDVIWPALAIHFPELPSFPNFGSISTTEKNIPIDARSPVLPESTIYETTNIEANQQSDGTVTITDTRFVPILSEQPETIVMKILKDVHSTIPYASPHVPAKSYVDSNPRVDIISKEHADILRSAENLLPPSLRKVFVTRMIDCVEGSVAFLDCTRDIAFPTIRYFYPRLPNFPNFSVPQKTPVVLMKTRFINNAERIVQAEIENILRHASIPSARLNIQPGRLSYEDARAVFSSLLSDQQINIIKLSENILPEAVRPAYRTKMIECIRLNNFLSCTQYISWPTLKQYIPTLPDFPSTVDVHPELSTLPQLPILPQVSQFPDLAQLPSISEFAFGNEFTSSLPTMVDSRTLISFDPNQMYRRINPVNNVAPTSVGTIKNHIPGIHQYTSIHQPANSFLNYLVKKKISSSGIRPSYSSNDNLRNESKVRTRRSIADHLHLHIDEKEKNQNDDESALRKLIDNSILLNVTESELLGIFLYISKLKNNADQSKVNSKEVYLIDQVDPDVRKNLTADQYEILKLFENLNTDIISTSFMSRLVQCIRSLSFIRCVGIFVWPMISNNLPSVPSLPSLPSLPVSLPLPGIGSFIGRSKDESIVNDFFGSSSIEFEKELLDRKQIAEINLKQWYESILNDKFDADLGLVKIRGYGNGELGISFSDSRNGKSMKAKNYKNISHILMIINDIMNEYVIESKVDTSKLKRNRIKKNRSMRSIFRKVDRQILSRDKNTERSFTEDRIFTTFLNKLRANLTNYTDKSLDNINVDQYLDAKDAYEAFEVLFGTRLTDRIVNEWKSFDKDRNMDHHKQLQPTIVPLQVQEESLEDALKVLPLDTRMAYDMELDESNQDNDEERVIGETRHIKKKTLNVPELTLRLPRMNEQVISNKGTETLVRFNRKLQSNAMQMMPGVSLMVSFVLQMLLSHARAAASVAGMLSNMAMGSAVFSLIRQSLFGTNTHPKIKYVYDNADYSPGVTWPHYKK